MYSCLPVRYSTIAISILMSESIVHFTFYMYSNNLYNFNILCQILSIICVLTQIIMYWYNDNMHCVFVI